MQRLFMPNPANRRPLRLEPLETRRLMIAEGTALNLSQAIDAAGLVGNVSAEVDWGDGNATPATLSGAQTVGNLSVKFDYRYDTGGFFTSARRAVLRTAADSIVKRFSDSLAAIVPSATYERSPSGQPDFL